MNVNSTRIMKCMNSGPHHARGTRRAFTLIELLLVLTILGILAAIVVPKMTGKSEQAKQQAAVTQISAFKTAINTYEVETSGFPRTLLDLMTQPRDVQNWRGPYLDSDAIPKDPWGHDYVYVFPGKHNPSSFDITSPGPDGQLGTDDDIGNWTPTRR